MKLKGWNDFEIGSVLFPFSEKDGYGALSKHQEDRKYTENSSFSASSAHWRVDKPVFNGEHCISCMNCWLYCPDSSIMVRDEKVSSIDYVHCKGCGVCSSVCPTNPKSLLMFDDIVSDKDALASWPKKEDKK